MDNSRKTSVDTACTVIYRPVVPISEDPGAGGAEGIREEGGEGDDSPRARGECCSGTDTEARPLGEQTLGAPCLVGMRHGC